MRSLKYMPAVLLAMTVEAAAAGRPLPATPQAAARPPPDVCVPPALGKDVPFGAGEKIEYEIDALGITIGTFSMATAPAHRPDLLTIVAHGRTEPFAASFYPVEAVARSHLGRSLDDHGYDEDATEDGVQRSVAVAFPPKGDTLAVHASKQGDPDDFVLRAPLETRDMLGALYQLRTIPLPNGMPFCVPIFGGRRIWTLRGTVTGRESVQTRIGEYKAIHLSAIASRLDSPRISREVHLWLSDDADHIPVAAFGLIQGKPVRAQLVKYVRGRPLPRR